MSESKSWIIVSDEGPSTRPVRHESFEEAKTESFRLAKLRPDLKFGVFELVGTATATPAKKTVTKWVNAYFTPTPNHPYPLQTGENTYDTLERAEREHFTRTGWEYLGARPFQVEIDVDQSVAFEVPTKIEEGKLEFRFYGASPCWGVSKDGRFVPFGGAKETAISHLGKDLSKFYSRPLNECPLATYPF